MGLLSLREKTTNIGLVLVLMLVLTGATASSQTVQVQLPSPGQISIMLTPLTGPYASMVALFTAGNQPVPGADPQVTRVGQTVYVNVYQVPLSIWLSLSPGLVSVTVNDLVYLTVYVNVPLPPAAPPVFPPAVGLPTFETPAATVTVDPATRAATVLVRNDRIQAFIQTQPAMRELVIDIPAEAQASTARFVLPTPGVQALAAAGKTLALHGPSFRLHLQPATLLTALPEPARTGPELALASAPVPADRASAILAEAAPGTLEGLVPAGPMVELDFGLQMLPVDLPLTHYPLVLGLPYDATTLGDISPQKLGVYRLDQGSGEWRFMGGRVDTQAGLVYARLERLSTYTVMAFDKTFADLVGHWSRADVEVMASKHMVRGMTPASFAPDGRITRAQFATLVVRALRLAERFPTTGTFSDVRPGDWHFGYVEAAARAGLVSGYPDGSFRPDAPITRQEMAALVVRAAKAAGREVSLTPAQEFLALFRFVDRESIAQWAWSAAARAVHIGVITGRTPEEYAPGADATRAEGTVMLLRLLKYLEEL